jgi:hypothetical protein
MYEVSKKSRRHVLMSSLAYGQNGTQAHDVPSFVYVIAHGVAFVLLLRG